MVVTSTSGSDHGGKTVRLSTKEQLWKEEMADDEFVLASRSVSGPAGTEPGSRAYQTVVSAASPTPAASVSLSDQQQQAATPRTTREITSVVSSSHYYNQQKQLQQQRHQVDFWFEMVF